MNHTSKHLDSNSNVHQVTELDFANLNKDSDVECGISEFDKEPGLPDGGFGWVVVAASFMVMFVIFGNVYSFGQIIQYYNKNDFKGEYDTLQYIATVNISIVYGSTLVTGRLDDRFGHRICILISGILYGLAFLLASFATKPWHLIMTLGVLLGLSGSVLCIATISAPLQWFDKRAGLASGISASGCGLGGLVLAPLVTTLLQNYGAPTVMRALGGAYFSIIMAAGLIIKDQTKPAPSEVSWHDCTILKNRKFLLLMASHTICAFGYLIPIYYLPNFILSCGLTEFDSSLIIALMNGSSAISRVICGLLSDKFGVMNLLLACLLIMFVTCSAVWPVSTNFTTLLLFGLGYGFGLGGFASLPPVVSAKLFGIRGISTTNGWIYFFAALPCLVGNPIANAITKISPELYSHVTAKYFFSIQYAGATLLLSAIILLVLKVKVAPKLLARV